MCNLYSNTTAVEAMRQLFAVPVAKDRLGNAEPLSAIYPKYEAPVVRLDKDGDHELINLSWGFRTTKKSKKTGNVIAPAAWNNARSDKVATSGLWKYSFQHRRCLVPASSYCEWPPGGRPQNYHWFALKGDEPRPPFAFAGMWQMSKYETKEGPETCETHTFLTTTGNELTRNVHPERMPVILNPKEYEAWLYGSTDHALELLRPYPAEKMQIVRKGVEEKADPG
ncbi:SOS response-associated peptidase [Roseobacter sp. EG26]|uniref:SOS response-associated peptidase n=1 Tax=Roseobacter sp. EG26 TaxID=3412477 RepID=UPI003CE4F4CC